MDAARDYLIRQLGNSIPVLALYGLPGVGKTTVAQFLTQDPIIHDRYIDGVLWAGLGRSPSVMHLLGAWGASTGLGEADLCEFTSAQGLAQAIQSVISRRRLLLVVDDAWAADDVLPFLLAGPECALVLTSRFPSLAFQLADRALAVAELDEETSIRALGHLAPQPISDEPAAAREIARLTGGLPLAISLIGRHLHAQSRTGQPRRVRAALDHLRQSEMRLSLAAPSTLIDPDTVTLAETSGPRMISLESSIQSTYDFLPTSAQHAWRALSRFPPKPNSFSEEAALAVSDEPIDALDTLLDAGIVESADPGRYTMHQAIADYGRSSCGLIEMPGVESPGMRLANWVDAFLRECAGEFAVIEREYVNLLAGHEAVTCLDQAELAVDCMLRLAPFFEARALWADAEVLVARTLAAVRRTSVSEERVAHLELVQGRLMASQGDHAGGTMHFEAGCAAAERAEDKETLCELLCRLGEAATHLGHYRRAGVYLERGLRLARDGDFRGLLGRLYQCLGEVADCTGGSEQQAEGDGYYRMAIAAAQAVGDLDVVCKAMQTLGGKAARRGEHRRGERYLREGLELARRLGHRQRTSALLNNLGMTLHWQGRLLSAEEALRESLDLARALGNLQRISTALQNLGLLELDLGRPADAAVHIGEGMTYARASGLPYLLHANLCAAGEMSLGQGKHAAAELAFSEALAVARGLDDPDPIAYAAYGLGRVLAKLGDIGGARALGWECVRLFEACGIQTARDAATWLAALSASDTLGTEVEPTAYLASHTGTLP